MTRPNFAGCVWKLREASLQELTQLRGCLELRDRLQFLESGSKRIRKTPDRPRLQFLVLWLEVEVMHGAGKVPRGFELPLHERLVDDYFRGNVCQLAFLPRLHLLSHRLEVSLHSINANRDAVDERERLRVFCEDGRGHA